MKAGLFFVLREGIEGLRRGTFHTVVSIAALTLAVGVLGVFYGAGVYLNRAAETLLGQFQFEAFISISLPDSQHAELEQKIHSLDSRWKVDYVSRQQAAAQFAVEFDPELFDVLRENPLPASFRITLPPQELRPDSAAYAANLIHSVPGIEEVIYDHDLLILLHSGAQKVSRWGVIAGVIVILLAVGLTYNAVRLKIDTQGESINLMSLLGATAGMLRGVFWVQGVLLGLLGGILSSGLLLGIVALARLRFSSITEVGIPYPYLIIIAGCFLGWLGAMLAAGRYLRI